MRLSRDREEQAVELRAQGLTAKQVAARMEIAVSTMRWYLKMADSRGPTETTAKAKARIAREIAEGVRCRCWLLMPCADHGS